jgi:hypothetical protein
MRAAETPAVTRGSRARSPMSATVPIVLGAAGRQTVALAAVARGRPAWARGPGLARLDESREELGSCYLKRFRAWPGPVHTAHLSYGDKSGSTVRAPSPRLAVGYVAAVDRAVHKAHLQCGTSLVF